MNFIERIQQKPEGQRRFFMLVSMLALSFLVFIVAWKSFERNLGVRLGGVAEETEEPAPGLLESLVTDIKRIAGGEKPLLSETGDMRQETRGGWIERIFSIARETRRVARYNAGEIQKWLGEIPKWLMEVLR